MLVRGCNAVSCLAMVVLSAEADHTATSWAHVQLRVVLFAVSGVGIGLSYYIPPSLFAIRFGGAGAGVVSSFLDGVQYLITFLVAQVFAALFALGVGWNAIWGLLAACYIAGALLTSAYVDPVINAEEAENSK